MGYHKASFKDYYRVVCKHPGPMAVAAVTIRVPIRATIISVAIHVLQQLKVASQTVLASCAENLKAQLQKSTRTSTTVMHPEGRSATENRPEM